MGRIGEVVEYRIVTIDGDEAAEITVDLGAGDVVTALDCNPVGLNARPRVGDMAIVTELDEAGEYALVGVVDVARATGSAEGEVYLYSRDATGALASLVHIKANGDVLVANSNGHIRLDVDGAAQASNSSGNWTLNANGTFTVNGHLTVKAT